MATKSFPKKRPTSPADAQPSGLSAPSMGLLALEFRAFWEFGAVVPAWPALMQAPRGDGHSVIVLPGLAASDTSTLPLRHYLQALGYEVSGWQQGSNFGPRPGVLDALKQHLRNTYAHGGRSGHPSSRQAGRKVSLVGWSLGGIYARELAKEMPELVRCVITLGTPFAGDPRTTHAWRLYEMVSGRRVEREADSFNLHQAPPVPTTSVYSKSDGIVAWQGSIQSAAPGLGHGQVENVQVLASHVGMGLNPSAWWTVADRLAQNEGAWQPFAKPKALGLGGWLFPTQRSDT